MIKDFIKKVGEFHKAFGIEPYIGKPTEEQIRLRHSLLKEEYDEYLEGFEAKQKGLEYFTTKKGEYVHTFTYMVDAINDMIYILAGTFHLLGRNINSLLVYDYYKPNVSEELCLNRIKMHLEKTLIYLEKILIYSKNKDFKYVMTNFECIYIYVLELAFNNGILSILPELFDEVHSSNMSKLDENGKPIINGENGVFDETRPKGKILKSSNFREPDLKSILEKYGKLI